MALLPSNNAPLIKVDKDTPETVPDISSTSPGTTHSIVTSLLNTDTLKSGTELDIEFANLTATSELAVSPLMSTLMTYLGQLINRATELQPIPMGILIAISMGMILTLPISSAALAISLKLSGLAAGASLVGCSVQMIGFAVASYRENGFGGFLAQGLGTSMLQVPNIIRNPYIWIPPIVVSGILGPISTYVFKMECNSIGAGMGTSGLVGQFGTIAAMADKVSPARLYMSMALLHFILPALLTLGIAEYMRKKGYIKLGDMSLKREDQSVLR